MEEREKPKNIDGSRKKKGIYRWGKSGRWKQIPPKFGGKSDATGLFAGRSGGQSGRPAGLFGEDRKEQPKSQITFARKLRMR
jgi:hypothetical protein